MITEDYASFETAKLLKEKGFDGNTNCYYIEGSVDKNLCYSPIRQNHNKRITNNEFDINIDITSGKISAPTLQMATKWLRKIYHLDIAIYPYGDYPCDNYQFDVYRDRALIVSKDDGFISHEQACEAAIKYCLENLI